MPHQHELNLPDGWFVVHGQPEPTPEEIDRVAAEIRSEWSPTRERAARGIETRHLVQHLLDWTPQVVAEPEFMRRPPE